MYTFSGNSLYNAQLEELFNQATRCRQWWTGKPNDNNISWLISAPSGRHSHGFMGPECNGLVIQTKSQMSPDVYLQISFGVKTLRLKGCKHQQTIHIIIMSEPFIYIYRYWRCWTGKSTILRSSTMQKQLIHPVFRLEIYMLMLVLWYKEYVHGWLPAVKISSSQCSAYITHHPNLTTQNVFLHSFYYLHWIWHGWKNSRCAT